MISVANDNGTGAIMLGRGDGYLPRISPTGTHVAWLSDNAVRGAALQVVLVPASEETATPEVSLGLRCTDHAWSPDGTRIACETAGRAPSSRVGPAGGITVVDIASKAKTVLVAPQGGQVEGMAWSPDGLRLAFGWAPFKGRDYTKGRLEVIGADGSSRTTLAALGAFPVWHATRGIAYARESTLICRGDTFADPQSSYRLSILDPATGASRVASTWSAPCALGLLPFGFLPDGRIVATLLDAANQRYPVAIQTAIVDPVTRRTTLLRFPDGGQPFGISADGTRLLVGLDFADVGAAALRSVNLAGKDGRTIVRNAIAASATVSWAP